MLPPTTQAQFHVRALLCWSDRAYRSMRCRLA
jgi:hypothetical protein